MNPLPNAAVIRRALPGDASALAGVFRRAVQGYGSGAYDAEQVRVWAQSAGRLETDADALAQGFTLLAEVADEAACFGRLFPDDHIDLLYCAPPHGRRGLASAVLAALEAEAHRRGHGRLSVDASLVARGLFERHGYRVAAEEIVELRGVPFRRFRMVKGAAP
ncbi:MAG: GNAT family N-acetyltransferase [Armatimonadetes bacterium]|nr:GNAT family N-acetyltransferase [Armatimonadota bacterium]